MKGRTSWNPVRCPECGASFTRAHNMRAHRALHAPKRPKLLCGRPGCGRTFFRRNDLMRHERAHDVRPYTCPDEACGRSFARALHLERHVSHCEFLRRSKRDGSVKSDAVEGKCGASPVAAPATLPSPPLSPVSPSSAASTAGSTVLSLSPPPSETPFPSHDLASQAAILRLRGFGVTGQYDPSGMAALQQACNAAPWMGAPWERPVAGLDVPQSTIGFPQTMLDTSIAGGPGVAQDNISPPGTMTVYVPVLVQVGGRPSAGAGADLSTMHTTSAPAVTAIPQQPVWNGDAGLGGGWPVNNWGLGLGGFGASMAPAGPAQWPVSQAMLPAEAAVPRGALAAPNQAPDISWAAWVLSEAS